MLCKLFCAKQTRLAVLLIQPAFRHDLTQIWIVYTETQSDEHTSHSGQCLLFRLIRQIHRMARGFRRRKEGKFEYPDISMSGSLCESVSACLVQDLLHPLDPVPVDLFLSIAHGHSFLKFGRTRFLFRSLEKPRAIQGAQLRPPLHSSGHADMVSAIDRDTGYFFLPKIGFVDGVVVGLELLQALEKQLALFSR